MCRSRFKSADVETLNSALSITRISKINISQVLHANEWDVNKLRFYLRSWKVLKFQSYSLLLRALTHPSISNWAERMLDLPKRSLGPNTLELLGDCVVGTCAARHVLSWVREPPSAPPINWMGGSRVFLPSLVGNRGMSITARNIGIEELMRWEKSMPPASHRVRLDNRGIDVATGMQSNVEVNGLAAAYESVSAAIYLDSGFFSALDFVRTTLLSDPVMIQNHNRESTDYEQELLREVVALFGEPVSLVQTSQNINSQRSSLEHVQVEVFDMQQNSSETVNSAHALFFAGVAIRRIPRPSGSIQAQDFDAGNASNGKPVEDELIALASHFSVETARIAALKQAIAILHAIPSEQPGANSKLRRGTVHVRMVDAGDIPHSLSMTTSFDESGRWEFDGDYKHVGNVLSRAGLRGFRHVANTSSAEIRKQLRVMRQRRECEERELFGATSSGRSFGHTNHNGTDDNSSGVLPRRNAIDASLDAKVVEECIQIGKEAHKESELHRTHISLSQDVENANQIIDALDTSVGDLQDLNRPSRLQTLSALHSLGHQTTRLWAAQCSIQNVSQDRSDVIPDFERRSGLGPIMEKAMMGNEGLAAVRDGGLRKSYVALGMCVERLGTSTALAWLSGAETKYF